MSTITTGRVPLRLPSASATFAIAIAGYLGVNLSPYMITVLETGIGIDYLAAGWIVTGALLATALVGLGVAPLCARRSRIKVARFGLVLGAACFGAAALLPVPWIMVAGLLLGGAGAGTAVAASGAAFAAFTNPDRVAGFNGLANRAVVTVVLAVLPILGLAPFSVFGALALFCLIGLLLSGWLPQAPAPAGHGQVATAADLPPAQGAPPGSTLVKAAGLVLLAVFALWAVTEDSLWAMGGVLGASQAGVTDAGLGLALSGATAGGLLGSLFLMIVGGKLGRAIPLGVLMLTGSALKAATGFTSDPTAFIVLFIAWNTVYAIAFMYFVAVAAALSADGRWSGPLLAVYLVGSSLTPVIGAGLLSSFGNQGFTLVLGIASVLLSIPTVAIALLSTRLNRAEPVPVPAAGQGAEPRLAR